MDNADLQHLEKTIHSEIKQVSAEIASLERKCTEHLKAIACEVSFIKQNCPNTVALEKMLQEILTQKITPQTLTPESLREEIKKVVETFFAPAVQTIIHEQIKALSEEIAYIKLNHPNKESLERTIDGMRESIVKTLTPKPEQPPNPLPQRAGI